MTDPASPSQISSSDMTMEHSAATRATTVASEDSRPADESFHHNEHNPITISCIHCNTILGDSSSWFCTVKEISGITFDHLVEVQVGELDKLVERGAYDALSTYRELHCGALSCGRPIGKQYLSTPKNLSHIQGKLTLHLDSIKTYEHSGRNPSIPFSESQEIHNLLRPQPTEMAESINQVKHTVVVLAENQSRLTEQVRDIQLMSDEHESLRTKLNNLDALVQSVVETQNRLVHEMKAINSESAGQIIPTRNGSLGPHMRLTPDVSPGKANNIWSHFAPKDRQDALEERKRVEEAEKTAMAASKRGAGKKGAGVVLNKRKPSSPLSGSVEPPAKAAKVAEDSAKGDAEVDLFEQPAGSTSRVSAIKRKTRQSLDQGSSPNPAGQPAQRKSRSKTTN